MASLLFKQVDVFTSVPFMGNPVAVVFDADGLDVAAMQRIANWTNLSETTFVLTPTDPAADYRLRIFTPKAELPFAGHPTIGSAHAVLEAGLAKPNNGKLVQQCGVGLVQITVPDNWQHDGLSFQLPPHQMVIAPDADTLHAALGSDAPFVHPPAIVDVGPRWVIVQYAVGATVRGLTPDLLVLADYDRAHGTTGLTVFAGDSDSPGNIVVRSFAPADGIAEDPVCGSGNGCVAAYRRENGLSRDCDSYVASQGREVGRDGIIRIRYADGSIHVGGCAVTCVDGRITIAR